MLISPFEISYFYGYKWLILYKGLWFTNEMWYFVLVGDWNDVMTIMLTHARMLTSLCGCLTLFIGAFISKFSGVIEPSINFKFRIQLFELIIENYGSWVLKIQSFYLLPSVVRCRSRGGRNDLDRSGLHFAFRCRFLRQRRHRHLLYVVDILLLDQGRQDGLFVLVGPLRCRLFLHGFLVGWLRLPYQHYPLTCVGMYDHRTLLSSHLRCVFYSEFCCPIILSYTSISSPNNKMFSLWLWFFNKENNRPLQVYCLGTILSMQISFVGFLPVQSSEHMGSLGVFGLCQIHAFVDYVRSRVTKDNFQMLFRTVVYMVGLAISVIGGILSITGKVAPWTGRFYSLLDPSYAKNNIPIIASVSEHQPTAWSSFYFDLQLLVFMFPVGLYYCFKKLTDANLFIVMYSVFSIYFAVSIYAEYS